MAGQTGKAAKAPEEAPAEQTEAQRIIEETRAACAAMLVEAQETAQRLVAESVQAAAEAAAAAPPVSDPSAGALVSVVAALEARMATEGQRREAKVPAAEEIEGSDGQLYAHAELMPDGVKAIDAIVFRAKGINFNVVRVPRFRWTAHNGEAQETEGRRYDFAPGRGDLTVRNSSVAEFLRGRPTFNVEFWEVGKEPHAAPDPSAVLDRIFSAVMELDDGALAEIETTEQASHSRPVILNAIRSARAKIQQAGS